jgi:hypothetical protein
MGYGRIHPELSTTEFTRGHDRLSKKPRLYIEQCMFYPSPHVNRNMGESFCEPCANPKRRNSCVRQPVQSERHVLIRTKLASWQSWRDHRRASPEHCRRSKGFATVERDGAHPFQTAELLRSAACAPLLWAILPTSLTLHSLSSCMHGSSVLDCCPRVPQNFYSSRTLFCLPHNPTLSRVLTVIRRSAIISR